MISQSSIGFMEVPWAFKKEVIFLSPHLNYLPAEWYRVCSTNAWHSVPFFIYKTKAMKLGLYFPYGVEKGTRWNGLCEPCSVLFNILCHNDFFMTGEADCKLLCTLVLRFLVLINNCGLGTTFLKYIYVCIIIYNFKRKMK